MKNFLLISSLLQICILQAQTKLASKPLVLDRPFHQQQIVNGVNQATGEVFAFAADKESVTILRTNSALFFNTSYKTGRPGRDYFISGYDFDAAGNPILYWATDGHEKIRTVKYDLTAEHTFPEVVLRGIKDEEVLGSFTQNAIFYLLTYSETNDDHLFVYEFNDGRVHRSQLDFSAFKVKKSNGLETEIVDLIEDYGVEQIDSRDWVPLFVAASPIKVFVEPGQVVFTLDQYSRETQTFRINLTEMNIAETVFPNAADKKTSANSFYYKNKLYQLSADRERLEVKIRDFNSGEIVKQYSSTKADSIAYRSSPLYIQTGARRAETINNTSRFLRKLNASKAAVSVYDAPGYRLTTVGGVKQVADTGEIMMGIGVGIGVALAGGNSNIYIGDMGGATQMQSTYFESYLDESQAVAKVDPVPLAVDHISEFISSHREVAHPSSFTYEDYVILGYYDTKEEQYVLRKFRDGFTEPFSK